METSWARLRSCGRRIVTGTRTTITRRRVEARRVLAQGQSFLLVSLHSLPSTLLKKYLTLCSVGGTVALTIDDPSETVKIAISYKDDPKSNSDFTTVVPAIARLDEGHQCYRIGEVPRDIEEGDNATIQLQYQAVENGKKQTFYACADIVSSLAPSTVKQPLTNHSNSSPSPSSPTPLPASTLPRTSSRPSTRSNSRRRLTTSPTRLPEGCLLVLLVLWLRLSVLRA